MKTSDKLFERLMEIPAIAERVSKGACSRTNANRAWLSGGAWSWYIRHDGSVSIGSQFTMAQCVAAKKLDISVEAGQMHVFVDEH